jgi:hypothetical protein
MKTRAAILHQTGLAALATFLAALFQNLTVPPVDAFGQHGFQFLQGE